ncbi:hypothetical protein [Rickettsia asembonensis]|nr:hypothetical protein [Rickettsia asembonensis]
MNIQVVIARRYCCVDRFMSFPRRRESSKTYKKQVFYMFIIPNV